MNKKIKVIELLNQLSKNNIYKRIKYGGETFEWSFRNEYRREDDASRLTDLWKIESILNDEVEILEDEEEIDINDIEEIKGIVAIDERGYITRETFEDFVNKINDLVKAVRKLDKNKVDYIQPYKED